LGQFSGLDLPKITKHILWKWLSNYLIISTGFFGLYFSIELLLMLFRGLETTVASSFVASLKYGLFMPLILVGAWMFISTVIKIFGFIPSRICKPKPILPEKKFKVEITNTIISVTNPDERVAEIALNDVTSIVVKTNNTGPWGMDVWFVVMGQDGEFCTYPMGATNDLLALDYYATLPGFELKGMNSTENAIFVCWDKKA
jgi:hypothetical protein